MYTLLLIAAGALAFGLVGCSPDDSHDKPDAGPPKPEIPPDSKDYPLTIEGKQIHLYHHDSNQDGIVQSGEQLLFQSDDQYIDASKGDKFENLRKSLSLPTFRGLNLGHWHRSYQILFPQNSKQTETAHLTKLVEFCREKNVDIFEATELSSHINAKTTIEKLDALTVAAFVLSLPKEGPEGFYFQSNQEESDERKSKENETRESNKEIVDTVIANIKAGTLTVKDARGIMQKSFQIAPGAYQLYNSQLDEMQTSYDVDLSRLRHRFNLLHELVHFFDDRKIQEVPVLQAEERAYLIAAEYAMDAEGLRRSPASSDAIEGLIAREYLSKGKKEGELPGVYALRVAYYRAHGDQKKFEEALRHLHNTIILYYYLIPELSKLTPPGMDDLSLVTVSQIFKAHLQEAKKAEGIRENQSNTPAVIQRVEKALNDEAIPAVKSEIEKIKRELNPY